MKISYTTPIQQSDLPELDRQLYIIKYTFQKRKRLGFFLLHPALISFSCGILSLIFKLAQWAKWVVFSDTNEIVSFLMDHTAVFFIVAFAYPILFRILFFPLFNTRKRQIRTQRNIFDTQSLSHEFIIYKAKKIEHDTRESSEPPYTSSIVYTLLILAVIAYYFISDMRALFVIFAIVLFIILFYVVGTVATFLKILYSVDWEKSADFIRAMEEDKERVEGEELYLKATSCDPVDEELLDRAAKKGNKEAQHLIGLLLVEKVANITDEKNNVEFAKAKPYFKAAHDDGLPDGVFLYAFSRLLTESHNSEEWGAILRRVEEINKDDLSEVCAKQYDDVIRALTDIKTRIGQQEARAAIESARWISQKKLEGWTYIPDGHGGYKFGPPPTSTSSSPSDGCGAYGHPEELGPTWLPPAGYSKDM